MFDCVIPAAGASSRMRSSRTGEVALPKQLLPFRGSTIVETAVRAALGAGCRVLLVVGHRADEVAAPFDGAAYGQAREGGRLAIVQNPRWEHGQLGSIQAALSMVEGQAFFIALADMPFVEPECYRLLDSARAVRAAPGRPEAAMIASHGGARGHPVLLPSAWIPQALALDPRGTMKGFLSGKPLALVEAGPGAIRDIDSLPDYEAALEPCQGAETR